MQPRRNVRTFSIQYRQLMNKSTLLPPVFDQHMHFKVTLFSILLNYMLADDNAQRIFQQFSPTRFRFSTPTQTTHNTAVRSQNK
jgi:hypothetical protein